MRRVALLEEAEFWLRNIDRRKGKVVNMLIFGVTDW